MENLNSRILRSLYLRCLLTVVHIAVPLLGNVEAYGWLDLTNLVKLMTPRVIVSGYTVMTMLSIDNFPCGVTRFGY